MYQGGLKTTEVNIINKWQFWLYRGVHCPNDYWSFLSMVNIIYHTFVQGIVQHLTKIFFPLTTGDKVRTDVPHEAGSPVHINDDV